MRPEPGFVPMNLAPPAGGPSRFIHVVGAAVWVDDAPADESWTTHFVGVLDDVACWAVEVPDGSDPSDGAALDLRRYHGVAGEPAWLAAGRAVQLTEWARTHRYCGRCGDSTVLADGERAMRCPSCGLLAFPRVAPAMIVLVTRGEDGPDQEALLARGVNWPRTMHSCLAGFVEPGESLEGAVVREVREEVGITVGDVDYRGSQPWPFPHSLMIGFRARYVSGEIAPDPDEIAEARWYHRGDLPQIPPSISIAWRLITDWLNEPVT
jgi:NAD+ diphosphatase